MGAHPAFIEIVSIEELASQTLPSALCAAFGLFQTCRTANLVDVSQLDIPESRADGAYLRSLFLFIDGAMIIDDLHDEIADAPEDICHTNAILLAPPASHHEALARQGDLDKLLLLYDVLPVSEDLSEIMRYEPLRLT